MREVFWGVAVKPGKPLSFGVRDGTLVFGLPGNPGVVARRRARLRLDRLRAMQAATTRCRATRWAHRDGVIRRNPHRDEFVRATRVDDGDDVMLRAISGQESHMIVRAAVADALVHVPRGDGEIASGQPGALPRARLAKTGEGAPNAAQRGGSRAAGIRRVATERERGDLGRRRGPGEPEERGAEREVADGEEPDDVERGVRHREAQLPAQQDEPDHGPGEPDEERITRAVSGLERQPEPRIQRRQHEHEGVGLEDGEPYGDRAQGASATTNPASRSSGAAAAWERVGVA